MLIHATTTRTTRDGHDFDESTYGCVKVDAEGERDQPLGVVEWI
jgi:hypothetical protein